MRKAYGKELESLPEERHEIAESLVNQLKYPEFYGEQTFIETNKGKQTKTINSYDCQVYDISKKGRLMKQLCFSIRQVLGIAEDDYDTLRAFYRFNYMSQTRIKLAMGKTDFLLIDYDKENIQGIPIESTRETPNGKATELVIESISTEPLDRSLFSIPNTKK